MKLISYTKSHTFHVAKVIQAPLRFVYDWCTDYRETDPQITGSKSKRRILLRANNRVIYTVTYRRGKQVKMAVDVVTLYPPKAWHLNFIGDEDDEQGDYVLTALGPLRTRLDMTFTEHYKILHAPSKLRDTEQVHEVWDKYIAALEKSYLRSR